MTEIKNKFYKEHPKNCRSDDFWGQVKRTVKGEPVSEEQINMIVSMIMMQLEISQEDKLLDLCCGNGALTVKIAEQCCKTIGVDFSEPLIEVAKKYFENEQLLKFILEDVVEYSTTKKDACEFTKALCYGSFQYLSLNDGLTLLKNIRVNFPNIKKFFIGNLPDKDKVDSFYKNKYKAKKLTDPRTDIGVWRTKEEFVILAHQTGWDITFNTMPNEFYSTDYRYDVLLIAKN